MPQPSATIIVLISSLDSILSNRAFSTLSIFPLSGSIAWNLLSLPCFAEPPAESPSTINISLSAGLDSWQSASFPGSDDESSAPFLLISSFAFLAASLALAPSAAFSIIFFATDGFSSMNAASLSLTMALIYPSTSLLPSFVFVCPSNCGLLSLILITAVSPSLTSSPCSPSFRSLSRFMFEA